MSKKYSLKNPFSLSKGSNYPSSICKMASNKFCSKNLFAILAKFSSICEILAMFKTNSIALKYPRRIRHFQSVWIFSWILRKHWFILSFLYIQQWLASSLDKNLFHVRLGHNCGMMLQKFVMIIGRDLEEISESGSLCTTDLFEDKTFSLFFQLFSIVFGQKNLIL